MAGRRVSLRWSGENTSCAVRSPQGKQYDSFSSGFLQLGSVFLYLTSHGKSFPRY